MTELEMNIAIHEARGAIRLTGDPWKSMGEVAFMPLWCRDIPHFIQVGEPADYASCGGIPDYCNDLNAMHEAENIMLGDTPTHGVWQAVFAHELFKVIHPTKNGEGVSEFDKIHATARQRADAFITTMKLDK